jgi:hypothetical protein
MSQMSDLGEIAARCDQVMNSPYMRRQPPPELENLRVVLERVGFLTTRDVPVLIAEIRRLRNRIKRLEAENEVLRSANDTGEHFVP